MHKYNSIFEIDDKNLIMPRKYLNLKQLLKIVQPLCTNIIVDIRFNVISRGLLQTWN